MLSSLAAIVSTFVYMSQTSADSSGMLGVYYAIGIPLAVALFGIIGWWRTSKAWKLTQDAFSANVTFSERLSFMLNARALIRSSEREGRATIRLEKSIENSLNSGYAVWLHDLHTTWVCKGIVMTFVYLLWMMAPYVANVVMPQSQFIVLLGLLDFLVRRPPLLCAGIPSGFTERASAWNMARAHLCVCDGKHRWATCSSC